MRKLQENKRLVTSVSSKLNFLQNFRTVLGMRVCASHLGMCFQALPPGVAARNDFTSAVAIRVPPRKNMVLPRVACSCD